MFEVSSKFKVSDAEGESLSGNGYYHFVTYRWGIPLFQVTFVEEFTSRLMVQGVGTLGLFAMLKFYEQPTYELKHIEVRFPDHRNIDAPWQTKLIVEAYEGQFMLDGEITNGIKYVCADSTIIVDPPEITGQDAKEFKLCLKVGRGESNAA